MAVRGLFRRPLRDIEATQYLGIAFWNILFLEAFPLLGQRVFPSVLFVMNILIPGERAGECFHTCGSSPFFFLAVAGLLLILSLLVYGMAFAKCSFFGHAASVVVAVMVYFTSGELPRERCP
jgi:hypothetical protein